MSLWSSRRMLSKNCTAFLSWVGTHFGSSSIDCWEREDSFSLLLGLVMFYLFFLDSDNVFLMSWIICSFPNSLELTPTTDCELLLMLILECIPFRSFDESFPSSCFDSVLKIGSPFYCCRGPTFYVCGADWFARSWSFFYVSFSRILSFCVLFAFNTGIFLDFPSFLALSLSSSILYICFNSYLLLALISSVRAYSFFSMGAFGSTGSESLTFGFEVLVMKSICFFKFFYTSISILSSSSFSSLSSLSPRIVVLAFGGGFNL